MSYSRWGSRGSGHWYTFWHAQDEETENRDTAIFDICCVVNFTAKELHDDMELCMKKAKHLSPDGDVSELEIYAKEFLEDVEQSYPSETGIPVSADN